MTALELFILFLEPIILETTFLIPANSKIARTGPPAITPVPGGAGLSNTMAALNFSTIWWGMVSLLILRESFFFLAAVKVLLWALGPSFPLPMPSPF